MAEPVGPSFLPGLAMYADTVTLSDTKVLTLTFPAKTVIAVLVTNSSGNEITAESIAWAASVSGNTATVTFTCAKSGSTIKFSYLVLASVTETIAANTLTADTSETPVQ